MVIDKANTATLKDNKFKDKKVLIWSFLSSAICILLGHGYFLLSNSLSFDTLHVIGQSDYSWKLSLGRFTQPLYKDLIRGNITAPWLIGILATVFLALSVYLIAKMFKITSKPNILIITGILSINLCTTVMVALYTHEFDVFMLAFLLQTIAVYIWHSIPRNKKYTPLLLIGSICICLSLGLYQAYISAGVSLVLMCLLFDCLNKSFDGKVLIIKVIESLAMFAVGCILYFLVISNFVNAQGVVLSSDTNGLTNLFSYSGVNFFDIIKNAYSICFGFLFTTVNYYSSPLIIIINWVLLIMSIGSIVYLSYKKPIQLVLSLILFALLPLGLNSIYLFSPTSFYLLMTHSFFLYYVAVIMIVGVIRRRFMINGFKFANILIIVLVSIIAFNNVRFANQVYFKKDLEAKAFQSYMTEVFTRMDSIEGYIPGETPVLFISSPQMPDLGYEFDGKFDVFGLSSASFYSTRWRFQWYLQFVAQRPIKLYSESASTEDIQRLTALSDVQAMPTFPSQGSMKIIEYVLVVNLSDNSNW